MSASGGGGFEPPEWFSLARAFFGLGASATAGGFSLYTEPGRYVVARTAEWLVSAIIGVSESLGALVVLINRQIIGAFGTSGAAVLGAIGSVGGIVLDLVGVFDSVVADLAAAAGPLSLLVVVGSWIVAALAGAVAVRALVEIYKLIPII